MKALLALVLLAAVQDKEQPPAEEQLADALKRAKEEKKRVLLTFGSPG